MMDSSKGTYAQIPNVFFDTCNLPETAQILFLRLWRLYAYKDQKKFTGSIRKLSKVIRLPKSTVDRMIKCLQEARLITVNHEPSDEENKNVMVITLNTEELWALNVLYASGYHVPIWDKELPNPQNFCPNLGQDVPSEGQDDTNLGRGVPDKGQDVPDVSSNTPPKPSKTSKKDKDLENTESPSRSINQIQGLPVYLRKELNNIAKELECKNLVDNYIGSINEIYQTGLQIGITQETFRGWMISAKGQAQLATIEWLTSKNMSNHLDYVLTLLIHKVNEYIDYLENQQVEEVQ